MLATGVTVDDATDRIHTIVMTVRRQEQRAARLERGKLVDEVLQMLERFQAANRRADPDIERRQAIDVLVMATRALAAPQ